MFNKLIQQIVTVILLSIVASQVFAVPSIQQWKTKNGAQVLFTQAPEIPMVDVRVVFDAGGARDGDLYGLASLTNGLITEGAGNLDANAIAQRMDDVGAQLSSGALRDMGWLSLRTLTEPEVLREAVGTFSMVLSKPTFPADAFERVRKNMLVGLKAEKQKPSAIAERAFMKALYGDHPYAHSPSGTEETLSKIKRKDIQGFFEKYYVANNAVIAIVGDLDRLKAEALAEVIASGLKAGAKAVELPAVKLPEKAKTVQVDFPSTQTHIWSGHPGITRTDKDYFPLYIGNHTLGGSGLVSLLSDEVREKRGYAYSAYSYFSPMRQHGPFQMALQTKTDHADNALQVMRQTVDDFLKNGITQKQLTASKQNITGGFALRLDSNSKLTEYLAMIGFYGLPLDYLNTFNRHVDAVTTDRVNNAFKQRLHPDRMITVIVGPKKSETVAAPTSKQ